MRLKQGLARLVLKSWESVSLQEVLQTDALAWRVSQEFETEFSSIGTGILTVCECPEIVKEQWNRLERIRVCVCVCVRVTVYMNVYMAVCEFPYFLLLTS